MKRFMALALLIGVSTFGLVGCEQKEESKVVKTENTPAGSIKETDTKKIEKSGDAKDPAPATPSPEAPK